MTNLAPLAQLHQRVDPFALVRPVVVPDVQLLEVDRLDAQVAEALLRAFDDVVVGENLTEWNIARGPFAVLRRNFRGDVDPLLARARDLADQSLAMPVAVGQRGVNEVQSLINRQVQRAARFGVIAAGPLNASDAPCAIADLRDLDPGSSQSAVFHRRSFNDINCGAINSSGGLDCQDLNMN